MNLFSRPCFKLDPEYREPFYVLKRIKELSEDIKTNFNDYNEKGSGKNTYYKSKRWTSGKLPSDPEIVIAIFAEFLE